MRWTAPREQTLLEALEAMHPGASRGVLRRMLTSDRVQVDGKPAHAAKAVVTGGAVVEVGARLSSEPQVVGPCPEGRMTRRPKRLRVLYEDAVLLVADKPPGLLSVPTDQGGHHHLLEAVRRHLGAGHGRAGDVAVVHRLDRETSGCILFAKDRDTRDILQEQFAERTIEREYHAVVLGAPRGSSGTQRSHLRETTALAVVTTRDERRGKEAITHWEVVHRGPAHALMRIRIETGRRAQIRIHMAELGCPVAGDAEHGAGHASVKRLCLHASALGFKHPDGRLLRVESPLPGLFSRLLGTDA